MYKVLRVSCALCIMFVLIYFSPAFAKKKHASTLSSNNNNNNNNVAPKFSPEDRNKNLWFPFNGKRYFLLGTNYPWYNGYRSLDFGRLKGARTITSTAMIKGRDLQHPPQSIEPGNTGFDAEGIDKQLADMEAMNVHVLRWFLGGDGRSFMNFDKDANCTGIDKETLANVDKAISLAQKHHIYLAPCLLDFRFVCGDEFVQYADGKPAPYFAFVFRDDKKRQALIEKFIKPLAKRYANSDGIIYWEIMNECANVVAGTDPVTGFQRDSKRGGPDHSLTPNQMQQFLNEAYDAIKSVDKKHPIMPSGLARPNQLPLIIGRVKADIYGAHYNDNGSQFSGIQSIKQLNQQLAPYKISIDKPLVMTEGPSSIDNHLAEYVNAAYEGGWAGVLPWEYNKTAGLNDFIRYRTHVTSKDGNPKSIANIEFYKQFAKFHQGDIGLE